MSISGLDFLDFAKDCMLREDEIGYRNAIARSYYCIYHVADSILVNHPRESHAGLAGYLIDSAWRGNEDYNKHDLQRLGFLLRQQHGKRKIADYRLNETITKHEANESLKISMMVMELIGNMIKPA